jgi:para-aminobenzoate synthetase component 1
LPRVKSAYHIASSELPTAVVENNWPRPGFLECGVSGNGYVGRLIGHGSRWCFEAAESGIVVCGHGDPIEAVWEQLQEHADWGPNAGAIGYISYEAGYAMLGLERAAHLNDFNFQIPDLQFLFFRSLMRMPPRAQSELPRARSYTQRDLDRLVLLSGVRAQISRSRYHSDVEAIRAHIAAGDIYQANYTQAFDVDSTESAPAQYRRLMAICPAPYNACLHFPEWPSRDAASPMAAFPTMTILGASPERLLRKLGHRLETRPIKGTIARATSPDGDQLARRRLILSKKDRAELLMITDLERNDLGKVAKVGSVRVDAIARLRRAPSVWHLESTVVADCGPNVTWVEALRALFPGGSITGAPKRRAVSILSELEPVGRGVYCGAYGWVDARGDCDFAVAIRTAVRVGDRLRLFGGGGIVYDSDPDSEYYESVIKIAPMIEAFTGSTGEATTGRSGMTIETEPSHA